MYGTAEVKVDYSLAHMYTVSMFCLVDIPNVEKKAMLPGVAQIIFTRFTVSPVTRKDTSQVTV